MSGVLITGATQPLGRRLTELLLEAGEGPVLAAGVEPEGGFPAAVEYAAVDLTHTRQIRRLLFGPALDMGVTCVVNLAHHRRPGERRARKLHVEATRLMLRLSEAHPTITRFVHRSTAEVYAARSDRPDLLREDHAVNLSPDAPAWVRHRVEADLVACTQMGMSSLGVAVLRCAEILAPDMGSQLHDYLGSRICLRPMGFDPILNLLSLEDAAQAFALAVGSEESGIFNIPGADTLTLCRAIRAWGRDTVGVPGPLMGPLYRARRATRRTAFRYDLNRWRFHFNGVLDGARARGALGYEPRHPISWPGPPSARPDRPAHRPSG